MDAPYYNGEPGAMPYDRDYDEPPDVEEPEPGCPYCEAQDDESHQLDCPLYWEPA